MTSKEARVETSEVSIPEYVESKGIEHTIPVFVSAFYHCVYLHFPDFDSVERMIDKAIDSDTEFVNRPSGSLVQPANVSNRIEAIDHLKIRGKLRPDGLPSRANDKKDGIKTTQYCLSTFSADNHLTALGGLITSRFRKRDDMSKEEKIELWLDIGKKFAKAGYVPSNRSGEHVTLGEWGRPTGSYVATVGKHEAGECPGCGEPKTQYWNCVKSSRRTRVPDRYKCENCGHTSKGITTG